MRHENKFRVFISYSHADADLADKIVAVLEANGLHPMLDKGFAIGGGFPEQIKDFISHAHVFMPIITKDSSKGGWVHQEIGFAMALNIPVVPISHEQDPGQMIRELHAVRWDDSEDWFDKNRAALSLDAFSALIRKSQGASRPLYECADLQEERTREIVAYTGKVIELGGYGHVRQKGALSSFHIPDAPVSQPVWRVRYGDYEVSEFRCQLQLKERMVLEEHARECGCSLIIDPTLSYGKYGKAARISRLKQLLQFFEIMPADKIRVAIQPGMPKSHNLLIVGNWFVAESKTAAMGKGFEQTNFTRHAPTIQAKIDAFDREFDSLLQTQRIQSQHSVAHAISKIREILSGL